MQKEFLNIQEYQIPLRIVTSPKRKRSISMQVKKEGVIVRAPKSMKEIAIWEFLDGKESWILKHWKKQLQFFAQENEYIQGSTISYYGREYPLEIISSIKKRSTISFTGTRFVVHMNESLIAQQGTSEYKALFEKMLHKRYKKQAEKVLILETETLAKTFGFKPGIVGVRLYKRKYGQCKGKEITYDYRIIKFPIGVIRHIILHELCHLKHKHHRKSFWDSLKSIDEGFETNLKWLKENGLGISC